MRNGDEVLAFGGKPVPVPEISDFYADQRGVDDTVAVSFRRGAVQGETEVTLIHAHRPGDIAVFVIVGLISWGLGVHSLEASKITLDTYMNDIDQARRAVGIEKVAILGHSAHGMMALEYARRFPQNTSHVTMIGTPPNMSERFQQATGEYWEKQASDERKAILKRNWERMTKDVLDKLTPSRRFIHSYLANAPKVFFDPNYDAAWVFEGHEYNMDVTDRVFSDAMLAGYDVSKWPGEVKTPVFLALGRHDYLVPYSLWEECKGRVPNLSFNLFEKSGHFPMLEERELFDQKLAGWIKTH